MKLQDFRSLIAVTIALIVLLAFMLNYGIARLRDSFGSVDHTNAVIRVINVMNSALLTAESGGRGYLLTGEQSYVESYKRARDETLRLMDTLDERVSDNAEQTARARSLRPELLARIDEFDRTLALGPPSLDQVLEILRNAREYEFTERIQSQLDEMRDVEFRLLAMRQADVNRNAVLVASLTAVISILAVLSGAFAAFISARQKSVAELRVANEALGASEQNLRQREAHLTAILATVPDAMVTIDERGRVGAFSATAERLFQYRRDEVIGRNVNILMPSPYREEHDSYVARYLATGVPHIIGKGRVVIGARKDGTTFPMELSVGQINMGGEREFVGFVRDLTERHEHERHVHEIQSELFRVSRLSTMGEMAGALAHELNQPLAAVSNYISAARRGLERLEESSTKAIRDMMGKAADQVLRAGGVIQRLRDFIARGQTERQVASLRQVVEESVGLAFVAVKDRTVQLTLQFDPTVDRVLVDKIQVQQVLLNLIRNAIEAMDAAPERMLRITTKPADDDDMVMVEVADRGSGISPEMVARLFEPFATSKSGGMGIGLSISRTIIESHGGDIAVAPNPNGGTIFRFTLPLAPAEITTAEPTHAG